MSTIQTKAAACHTVEIEVAIKAPRAEVWKTIFEETDHWWLPDFRVAGTDSKVTFDPTPGGKGLIETTADGGGLQWFATQMYVPSDFKIYVVGHIAPEWGGPATSNLKLALSETETGCILQVSDSRHGNVDPAQVKSYEDGWNQLFTDGLKAYVEKQQA